MARRRPPRTPQQRPQPRAKAQPPVDDLPLLPEVRRALRSDDPWAVAMMASGIAWTMRHPADVGWSAGDLVDSFIGVDVRETTALLAALAPMVDHELSVTIRRALMRRTQPLPAALQALAQQVPVRGAHMTSPGDRGENLYLQLSLPDGGVVTWFVYVDYSLGTIVKDAFYAPQTIDQIWAWMQERSPGTEDAVWTELSHADVRARLELAIARHNEMLEGPVSDTWPMCQPLLEVSLATCPEGGDPRAGQSLPLDGAPLDLGPDDPVDGIFYEVDLPERAMALAIIGGMDLPDDPELYDAIWVMVTGPLAHGGDPLDLSEAAVVGILESVAPYLPLTDEVWPLVPEALRIMTRHAARVRSWPGGQEERVIAAIDAAERFYGSRMTTPEARERRRQMREATAITESGMEGYLLDSLASVVGGRDVLDALDTEPLPDEPLDLTGVPETARDRVTAIAAVLDTVMEDLFDGVEARTACRRVLTAIARTDHRVLMRGRVDTAAGAIAWIVANVNELTSPYGPVTMGDLMEACGIASGSVSQRATTLLGVLGIYRSEWSYGSLENVDPSWLVAEERAELVEEREAARRG